MGRDKALISFAGELLLERVCRLVSGTADPVIVVAAQDQQVPDLSFPVHLIRDELPDHGPLAGFVSGLNCLSRHHSEFTHPDMVFLGSCDAPFLNADVMNRQTCMLQEKLDSFDGHVVLDRNGTMQPFHGVYSMKVDRIARRVLESGRRSLHALTNELRLLQTPADFFSDADPELLFLKNINTIEELAEARAVWDGRTDEPAR